MGAFPRAAALHPVSFMVTLSLKQTRSSAVIRHHIAMPDEYQLYLAPADKLARCRRDRSRILTHQCQGQSSTPQGRGSRWARHAARSSSSGPRMGTPNRRITDVLETGIVRVVDWGVILDLLAVPARHDRQTALYPPLRGYGRSRVLWSWSFPIIALAYSLGDVQDSSTKYTGGFYHADPRYESP